ncbi:MAG: S24 family peptidase [Erysipelotrichaceae bacterium]
MELREIIQQYKDKYELSSDDIAKEIGVSKSAVSKWLSGDVKKLKEETIDKINNIFGYDIRPFLKGQIIHFEKPILGYVKGGYDLFFQQEYLGYEEVSVEDDRQGDYFLKVVGDSMIGDGIMDQSLVYVRNTSQVANNTICVVSIGNEEITIKRVIFKNDMLILQASNPLVSSRFFTLKEINELPVKIIGKVLYVKTNF